MAEDRLEEVISEAMGNPLTGRVMHRRLEKSYPELKTDVKLREKCAEFITAGVDVNLKKKCEDFIRSVSNENLKQECEAFIEKVGGESLRDIYVYNTKGANAEKLRQESARFLKYMVKMQAFPRVAFLAKMGQASLEVQKIEKNQQKDDKEFVEFAKNLGLNIDNADELQVAKDTYVLYKGATGEKIVLPEHYKEYRDLNTVIDDTYPLLVEFAGMNKDALLKLNIKNAKNPDMSVDDIKENLTAYYDKAIHYSAYVINNETSTSSHLGEKQENESDLNYAKRAIEIVSNMFATGSMDKTEQCLQGLHEHRIMTAEAMKNFGSIMAEKRDISSDMQIAKLCDSYAPLALVAIARAKQTGEKVSTAEQFEAMLDRVENVRAVVNNNIKNMADAEMVVYKEKVRKGGNEYE